MTSSACSRKSVLPIDCYDHDVICLFVCCHILHFCQSCLKHEVCVCVQSLPHCHTKPCNLRHRTNCITQIKLPHTALHHLTFTVTMLWRLSPLVSFPFIYLYIVAAMLTCVGE